MCIDGLGSNESEIHQGVFFLESVPTSQTTSATMIRGYNLLLEILLFSFGF